MSGAKRTKTPDFFSLEFCTNSAVCYTDLFSWKKIKFTHG